MKRHKDEITQEKGRAKIVWWEGYKTPKVILLFFPSISLSLFFKESFLEKAVNFFLTPNS